MVEGSLFKVFPIEEKKNFKSIPVKYSYNCYICKHYKDCDLKSRELKCSSYNHHHCTYHCKKCYRRRVIDICPYFIPFTCEKINKPPYVCNTFYNDRCNGDDCS